MTITVTDVSFAAFRDSVAQSVADQYPSVDYLFSVVSTTMEAKRELLEDAPAFRRTA
jgi:hypothetical protein